MISRPSYKRIRKDYQTKNLHNPFFHKKPAPKNPNRVKWILLAIILVVVFAIWFFLAAPVWRIKTVKVTGLTRLDSAELGRIVWDETAQRRGLLFHESNIFLFKRDEVVEKIIAAYNFSGAEIRKGLPGTIELKVTERPYAFIFQEGDKCYYASADAYIFKEPAVSEEDKKKYFILENKNPGTMIIDGEKISIKAEYLGFIFDLSRRLSAYPELPVKEFIVDQEFNTVKAAFISGPMVFFKVKEGADVQVSRLLLVKREKIKDNFSKTDYIDLRYGDKIFINPDFN